MDEPTQNNGEILGEHFNAEIAFEKEILPQLKAISLRCDELGIPMMATFTLSHAHSSSEDDQITRQVVYNQPKGMLDLRQLRAFFIMSPNDALRSAPPSVRERMTALADALGISLESNEPTKH